MKRRKFIRNSLVGAGVLSAGCSETNPSGNSDGNTSSATPTETVVEGSNSVSSDLPPPPERNYDEISYDIELPANTKTSLSDIERNLDYTIFAGRRNGDIPEEIQRSESYLSVSDRGTTEYQNLEGETVEADLFGLEADFVAEREMTNEQIITTATHIIGLFADSGDIYEEADAGGSSEDHVPLDGEYGFSQISLSIEAENLAGNVTYTSGAEENSMQDYWTMMGEYIGTTNEVDVLADELEEDMSFS